jgi:membrane protein
VAVSDRSTDPHSLSLPVKLIVAAGAFAGLALLAGLAAAKPRRDDDSVAAPAGPVSDDGRGRRADAPAEIPRRGWKDIARRVWNDINANNIGLIAAGVAFYALLSVFPGIAALVGIYGLVADPSDVRHLLDLTGGLIPGEANDLIGQYLRSLIEKPQDKLGFAVIGGILLALWSAGSAVDAFMTALNIVYEEPERRGFIKRHLLALGLTLGGILFVVLALALVAVLPAIIDLLPFEKPVKDTLLLVRWPILALLAAVGLAAIYRYAPSRQEPKWRWVSWGAALATFVWILGSIGFSLYVRNFGSYDKTYGSIGAVIVLLMWFYVSAYIVLAGAELNAEMEHQTAEDSTRGPPKPLGLRQARMADTLGAAS